MGIARFVSLSWYLLLVPKSFWPQAAIPTITDPILWFVGTCCRSSLGVLAPAVLQANGGTCRGNGWNAVSQRRVLPHGKGGSGVL